MGNPLFGFAEANGLARGPYDADDARATRRRVAIIVYALLLGPIAALGGWTRSGIVFGLALVLVVAALLVFAERGDRIAARFRRES